MASFTVNQCRRDFDQFSPQQKRGAKACWFLKTDKLLGHSLSKWHVWVLQMERCISHKDRKSEKSY